MHWLPQKKMQNFPKQNRLHHSATYCWTKQYTLIGLWQENVLDIYKVKTNDNHSIIITTTTIKWHKQCNNVILQFFSLSSYYGSYSRNVIFFIFKWYYLLYVLYIHIHIMTMTMTLWTEQHLLSSAGPYTSILLKGNSSDSKLRK